MKMEERLACEVPQPKEEFFSVKAFLYKKQLKLKCDIMDKRKEMEEP